MFNGVEAIPVTSGYEIHAGGVPRGSLIWCPLKNVWTAHVYATKEERKFHEDMDDEANEWLVLNAVWNVQ
jgi:hypothetical protein